MSDYTGLDGGDAGDRLRAVGAGIGLTLGGFLVATIVIVLGITVLGTFTNIRDQLVLLYPTTVILQGLGFGLTVAAFLYATERTGLVKARLPSLSDLGLTVLGTIALIATLAGVNVVFTVLGVEAASNQIVEIGAQNPEIMLYMIPLAFLVIGPGEELLFRGAIQGIMRESYAAVPAIVLSSALFAVAHVTALTTPSLAAKTATIAALFALSLILGALYEYTENLVVPSLVHGAYDAILFVAIYAQATGMVA
ncbi:CPBP family intramembrane glutamic endopeptidase [Natronomonas sp. EA1]|uniref:CPBP family intramembrane glutamic endopeptidase n=1 Tax=Natronomonas sp. EA1 TaxID=3421655 RepID=UPI003EB88BBA